LPARPAGEGVPRLARGDTSPSRPFELLNSFTCRASRQGSARRRKDSFAFRPVLAVELLHLPDKPAGVLSPAPLASLVFPAPRREGETAPWPCRAGKAPNLPIGAGEKSASWGTSGHSPRR